MKCIYGPCNVYRWYYKGKEPLGVQAGACNKCHTIALISFLFIRESKEPIKEPEVNNKTPFLFFFFFFFFFETGSPFRLSWSGAHYVD